MSRVIAMPRIYFMKENNMRYIIVQLPRKRQNEIQFNQKRNQLVKEEEANREVCTANYENNTLQHTVLQL